MKIPNLPRWATWTLVFPLLVINGWLLVVVFHYFQSIISVFIVANLLAFILDYPVRYLTAHRIKRLYAVLAVVLLGFSIIGALTLILAPIIFNQLDEFAHRLPSWIDSGSQQLQAFDNWATARKLPLDLTKMVTQQTERFASQLQSLTGEVFKVAWGTVGSAFDLLLTVILTFYLLLHGQQLWYGLGEWLPQPLGEQIRQLLRQNFHNYYIGQASLASIIGVSMAVTFSLLGVPLSLLFGVGVGLMAFFPFGAGFTICLVSLLMALRDLWLGAKVLIVATLLEQVIENGIAPRLLGGFTGLNPVWVLLALLIGVKIGGIVGLLIAIPMAGFIKGLALKIQHSKRNVQNISE